MHNFQGYLVMGVCFRVEDALFRKYGLTKLEFMFACHFTLLLERLLIILPCDKSLQIMSSLWIVLLHLVDN